MYSVKKQGDHYKVYNTNRKAFLSKNYATMAAARKAVVGLKKRTTGVKAYHSCAKNAGCGKKKAPKKANVLSATHQFTVAELRRLSKVKTNSKFTLNKKSYVMTAKLKRKISVQALKKVRRVYPDE
jgi:hypothetical protein